MEGKVDEIIQPPKPNLDSKENNENPDHCNKRWFPLESNPDALNKYIAKLGFDTSQYQFVDVYSTESWALEMIPSDVLALLLLYPITPAQEKHRMEEKATLSLLTPNYMEEKVNTDGIDNRNLDDVWFLKQRIGNACGTIAILHALANIQPEILNQMVAPQSWLKRFLIKCTENMDGTNFMHTGIQRAEVLENDREIESMHEDATSDENNQTTCASTRDEDVDTHFIAFVPVKGRLYELDGRKDQPISHGITSGESFLVDACRVVETFMSRDPDDLRFTMLALTSCSDI